MSLILEALRKSEAERRRAQVPDLLAEPQPVAPVAARAAPRWPLFLGAAIVVAGVAWVAMRNAAPPASAVADATPVESIDPAPTPTPVVATPVSRPAPALKRPLVIAAPAPAAPPAATTPTPPQAPAQVAALSPPPAPRALPAPPPAPVVRDDVERVADLGADDRKALPPLKLSMHMWNDVVAQRFVIIDGARLGVGDHLGPVVVADIVPDGVVLDWNGRALKLPLR